MVRESQFHIYLLTHHTQTFRQPARFPLLELLVWLGSAHLM